MRLLLRYAFQRAKPLCSLGDYIKMSYKNTTDRRLYKAGWPHIKYGLWCLPEEYRWPACLHVISAARAGRETRESLACENECEALIPRMAIVALHTALTHSEQLCSHRSCTL